MKQINEVILKESAGGEAGKIPYNYEISFIFKNI